MDPRATRRLTPRTATKPAKSLARSSVSSTVSFATMLPHGGHFRRDQGGRKGDKTARFPPAFHSASGPSHHAPLHRTSCGPDSAAENYSLLVSRFAQPDVETLAVKCRGPCRAGSLLLRRGSLRSNKG